MRNTLSALQWAVFMIAGSIVAPVAIASLFNMDPAMAAGFVQRTMFVLGVAGILQVTFGHRLPINEGPAGLWWGVFVLYAGLSSTLFGSDIETLQALELAMIASGVIFILLSAFGLVEKLSRLFTPVVTGIYLLLLVAQLSGSFLNGMMGVGYLKEGIDLRIAGLSLLLVFISIWFSRSMPAMIQQYSILIILIIGWIIFAVFGLAKPIVVPEGGMIELPEVLAFGYPTWDSGMIITAFLVTLLLLTNMIASIRVVEEVLNKLANTKPMGRYRQAGFVSGINQLLGGVFSAVGSVPISGAAGFILTTGLKQRLPFVLGSGFIIIISLFPALMGFFAALPEPVGYAVIFIVFVNMVGIAFNEFKKDQSEGKPFIIGISFMVGIGTMFIPPEAFQQAPPIAASILNNGLILGSITAILTEQILYKRQRK
ncbi:purine/pyrimidine permease [Anaerobacillus sp. 1_MG-2023]|uniref:purine/pyrimidine permease n=1 Tax=Anaerobacillus sp. 1_MG-2023 TaxID=3062655 RepID=UPI0026E4856E|nr:purine/pyrimidine permease [Anaerobacillus sp. 1_MG-2023]MDO6658442.1 purine/pyrimidine permease [Anaerobacillus sp. 1_MG-2023]